MIKSLFEENAEQAAQNKAEENEVAFSQPASELHNIPRYIEVNEAEDLPENPETAAALLEIENSHLNDEEKIQLSDEKLDEIFNRAEPPSDSESEPVNEIPTIETRHFHEISGGIVEMPVTGNVESDSDSVAPSAFANQMQTPTTVPFENTIQATNTENFNQIVQSNIEPQSFAETARQSGLAYAAAITLFASVVFMLIIGWFADLLFGSSPWGKVGGIVLGSLIGFIQLFRITSQIFKNK